MAIRSRRLKTVSIESGIPIGYSYCRRCMQVKLNTGFFSAIDFELDKNGFLSICKSCVDELFENILHSENNSIEKTVLRMCKLLNIKFSMEAIEAAKKQIESKGSDPMKFMGYYKAKLVLVSRDSVNDGANVLNLIYQDNPTVIVNGDGLKDEEFLEAKDIKLFWGTDDKDDLQFLENEYTNFKASHKADTYAEKTLLKEVCHKLLEIHKSRKADRSTDSSLKQLMEVMKNLAISPNMTNAANSGENLDTFGKWIEDIEKYEPAQWREEEGRPLYKDMDDIEGYFQKFCVRPLRNFILQSKDFNIEDDDIKEDDTDIFESSEVIEDADKPNTIPE